MEFRDKPMENLMRLQEKDICKNVNALLLEGEQIVGAYKTVRDQVVFTSHRIIMVDMQGVTGTRQRERRLAGRAGVPQLEGSGRYAGHEPHVHLCGLRRAGNAVRGARVGRDRL